MAKPETFPKGPHAAMGVRGPPGEDPGRSSAAAENLEAVARADGMGRRQTAEPCNATSTERHQGPSQTKRRKPNMMGVAGGKSCAKSAAKAQSLLINE